LLTRALSLVLFVFALALASASAGLAYPWPFKPFDRQHPIRALFGDPRTVYENGILAGAFDGPGLFSFHQGIDISAPNGTPIYAVADGTAHYMGAASAMTSGVMPFAARISAAIEQNVSPRNRGSRPTITRAPDGFCATT